MKWPKGWPKVGTLLLLYGISRVSVVNKARLCHALNVQAPFVCTI